MFSVKLSFPLPLSSNYHEIDGLKTSGVCEKSAVRYVSVNFTKSLHEWKLVETTCEVS